MSLSTSKEAKNFRTSDVSTGVSPGGPVCVTEPLCTVLCQDMMSSPLSQARTDADPLCPLTPQRHIQPRGKERQGGGRGLLENDRVQEGLQQKEERPSLTTFPGLSNFHRLTPAQTPASAWNELALPSASLSSSRLTVNLLPSSFTPQRFGGSQCP